MASTKGSGSIIQKEKDKPKSKYRKWQLRVSTGCDPRTGKYKTKVKTVTGTYSDAKAALREFIKKVEEDKVTGRTKYTFEEYAKRYVDMRTASKEVAPTTLKKQSELFKCASRHIGKAKLESITPPLSSTTCTQPCSTGIRFQEKIRWFPRKPNPYQHHSRV